MTNPDGLYGESDTPEVESVNEHTAGTGTEAPPSYEAFLEENPYPEPIIDMTDDQRDRLLIWLDTWFRALDPAMQPVRDQITEEEIGYQAQSLGPQQIPFVGACGEVVPLIAMAVDPVHARLDTGCFKPKPMVKLTGLRRDVLPYIASVETFLQYYFSHILNLRTVLAPRLFEFIKHGTMVLKVEWDHQKCKSKGYDEKWDVQEIERTTFRGPRISGVDLSDLLFPTYYQSIQDCPIVFERIRTSIEDLRKQEYDKKITNVKELENQPKNDRSVVERQREEDTGHRTTVEDPSARTVYAAWFDYSMEPGEPPAKFGALWEPDTRTLLMCRYNWYFHQQKPYATAPYMVRSNSILGTGLGRMLLPFQNMLTSFHRLAMDNAYLANIRMFVAVKGTDIEEAPRLMSGRVITVNARGDLEALQLAETYPSTLAERQNIIGLAEKRTGISDYLTGRESPIVGSRATATSTVALIQEGTKRVEEVLDNVRNVMAEVTEMCFSLWIQYGLGTIEDVAFGSDQVASDVRAFFDLLTRDNVGGAVAVDLAATDASNNKSVQQQMKLSIISTLMGYFEKTLQAGQLAVQAAGSVPPLKDLVVDMMERARTMFMELLQTYDIPNPQDYLPDIEKFNAELSAATTAAAGTPTGPGGAGPGGGGPPGAGAGPGVPSDMLASLLQAGGSGGGAPSGGGGGGGV